MTTPQALAQAVRRVWRRHPRGYGFLAARRGELWIERGFRINDSDGVEEFFTKHSFRRHDLYLCLNSFKRARRLGMYAYETPFAHVDIDTGDPTVFDPPPTILTETSPSRYQGIWEFATAVEATKAEAVSRHLTRTYGGDPGGWSATKMLRIAGSLNHKPMYDLPRVAVVRDLGCALPAWPNVIAVGRQGTKETGSWVNEPADYDVALERFRAALKGLRAEKQMWLRAHVMTKQDVARSEGIDRSHILRQIVCRLRDLGLTDAECFALAWWSGWNKFRVDNRSENDLWREVDKAYGK